MQPSQSSMLMMYAGDMLMGQVLEQSLMPLT